MIDDYDGADVVDATGVHIGTVERTYVDENLVLFSYTLIRATQEIIPAILPEVTADKPDYILYDSLCVWGKCVAQILQVPAIASVTTLARPHSLLHTEVLARLPLSEWNPLTHQWHFNDQCIRSLGRCGSVTSPMNTLSPSAGNCQSVSLSGNGQACQIPVRNAMLCSCCISH